MKKLYGVAVNDANYPIDKRELVEGKMRVVWSCPFYKRWSSMITRCYSGKLKSYDGCFVCDEWLVFSSFKSWMENQDWKGKQLDKDLFSNLNKEYSPEKCVFVSQAVNKFITNIKVGNNGLITGVFRKRNKFRSSIKDYFTGKYINLGVFDSETLAHNAWISAKREIALKMSQEINDAKVKRMLVGRY